MKKIFAILVSLLFVASVFGITQTIGSPNCCDSTNFEVSKTTVRVGETFTLTVNDYCLFCLEGAGFEDPCDVMIVWSTLYTGPPEYPFPLGSPIETVGVQDLGQHRYIITLKAVSPGTLVFKNTKCFNEETKVKILPKALPMDWIMKKFGLGNKDKD